MKRFALRWVVLAALVLNSTSCGNGVDPRERVRPQFSAYDRGTAQERRMAALIRGHSGQSRESMRWDSRLARAARKRARDMARRGYFGHVDPDGKGPNWYVTQTGYRLPLKWIAFPSENKVESIVAGYASADVAFDKWLHSRSHRTHLMGRGPLFEKQTRFGIAHVTVPGSRYKDYWVFLSAPPERQAPQ